MEVFAELVGCWVAATGAQHRPTLTCGRCVERYVDPQPSGDGGSHGRNRTALSHAVAELCVDLRPSGDRRRKERDRRPAHAVCAELFWP